MRHRTHISTGSAQASSMSKNDSFVQMMLRHKYTPILIVVVVSLLVHAVNLLNYPAWFFDEGAYLTFSRRWAFTGTLGYYEHLFGAFLILGAMFLTVNPASYLISRILMVAFSALDGILLYKIARMACSRSDMFPLVASLIYVATPLSARYLRLTVVDDFMTPFLLLTVFLVLSRPRDKLFSSISFGAAVLCKQTAIFFLPALFVFFLKQKRPLTNVIVWVMFAAVLPVIWVIYGTFEVGLSTVVTSQVGLTGLTGERAVSAVGLIIQRISSRDPFTFLGLAGIVWALYKRDLIVTFPLAYLGFFVVLFLRISTVYLIPALPFFALVATAMLWDFVDLVPRLPNPLLFRRVIFAGIILVLIVASLFIVVTQSPAIAQQDAVNFVVSQHPPGVILSYTYYWLFQQNHPSITIYDRYAVPWNQLVNRSVYLIVDYPGDLNTVNSIPQYQLLYQNSKVVWTETTYGYTVQVLNGTIT